MQNCFDIPVTYPLFAAQSQRLFSTVMMSEPYRRFAFLLLVFLATSGLRIARAHAERGHVVLRDGGRVEGRVEAVLPNDRVVVLLSDGTSTTLTWDRVLFVVDGQRVYDREGAHTTVEPPSTAALTPPAATAAAAVPSPPAYGAAPSVDPRLWDEYAALPGVGGGVALEVMGSLVLTHGLGWFLTGAIAQCDPEYDDHFCRLSMSLGAVQIALGGAMLGGGIYRIHRRRRALLDLRRRGLVLVGEATRERRVALRWGASPRGLGPGLTLHF